MASKGPRSKLDHETRAKRQKALEASRELRRPKTHWDHVLDEMIWLSKDFEAERKWKLALAKKVALRASKGMLDQATRGEKRIKEEEQRMRKVALNISKDVKKFWTKIEKLVLYKHQLELDDKKKKALDKQLEYLLGQTERYSTMLAENLLGTSNASGSAEPCVREKTSHTQQNESCENTNYGSPDLIACKSDTEINTSAVEADDDYNVQSEDDLEDDEQTIEEDEALISKEEREEELAALQNEANVPLDELLKHYSKSEEARSSDREIKSDAVEADDDYSFHSEDDLEDDEQTIEEDEALITKEENLEELDALKSEADIPLDELLKRYSMNEAKGESSPEACDISGGSFEELNPSQINGESSEGYGAALKSLEPFDPIDAADSIVVPEADGGCSEITSCHREKSNSPPKTVYNESIDEKCNTKLDGTTDTDIVKLDYDFNDEQGDDEFVIGTGEEEDDETTLKEEEELAKREAGDPEDEIALLQKESEIPLEELLAQYNKDFSCSDSADDEYSSPHSDQESLSAEQVVENGESSIFRAQDDNSPELRVTSPPYREESVAGNGTGFEESSQRDARIADATAAARSAQPTGNTFSTTNVRTKFPFLIKYPLREYQHIGLDWLVTMYEKRLNGILADEMGLGKTIMTISLLAHLACEKGIWGPHLIVVPTSVMLNWETEFLKWCPAFKILTYFGSAKERKYKRQGWMKPNSFHVCITTYRLVIQDSKIFKRKKWKYLILDEAHLIKNWKSQRWQTLLNFNSKRRILLTGTPLQNDLMELWSLMHFLMPHIFQSHQEFKDWFCNPISGMVEGQEKVNKEVVDRLHNVLRPFILRRLKRDVEKQLPMKQEHVIYCRLSKRQRNLYEDFIASSETQATLANGNFIGMLNVIMQLRKVCNHPDLFEGRPIISSFDMEGIEMQLSSNVCSLLSDGPFSSVNLPDFGFVFTHLDFSMASWESDEIQSIATPSKLIEYRPSPNIPELIRPGFGRGKQYCGTSIFEEIQKAIFEERLNEAKQRAADIAWWNSLRCRKKPVFSTSLRKLLTIKSPVDDIQSHKSNPISFDYSSKLASLILSPVELFERMRDQVECFMFAIPAARAPAPVCWCSKSGASAFIDPVYKEKCSQTMLPLLAPIRPAIVRRQLYFPDRRLIQFDCGKLQQLAVLLRRLKSEGHRALIFTQMTKMLDILEAFINLYGYTYVRLDGSTQPEERQTLMQRFNTNPKIFLFILSTRSGGVGINLVGADTVIFYDSDWNPAMDQQAQDRCHRIGQTREVHIYRLISESTIEENILKKANQKRALDDLVIQSGGYNTEFFKKLDPMELFSGHRIAPAKEKQEEKNSDDGVEVPMSSADLEAALRNAEDEADYMALKRVEEEEAVDNQEFTEEAIGRLEDDDLANEDGPKVDESKDLNALVTTSNKVIESNLDGDKSFTIAGNDDDIDMIADVKQMAAAAAASGQAALSFENQLRPIDRYAMRFLELWDPIINKSAIEYQVQFDEREWELERLEKLKEDMEAEVDDDDEPLVYEKWDAEFATQAYHQHVEALAQQEMMEELERKAKEKELSEDVNGDINRNEASGGNRSKSKKKKTKKSKLKSLKKESLPSTSEACNEEEELEDMLSDCEDSFQEDSACRDVLSQRKRKKDETTPIDEEKTVTKVKSKKTKKTALVTSMPALDSNLLGIPDESKDSTPNDDRGVDLEMKPASRVKPGGKIIITTIPMKRIYTIKPEKLKKKGSLWSSDCFPSPDSWTPQEDAVLCALLHEYGPNWSLASDTLYGMTAGGHYRGRFRHPILCCERIRELAQKSVQSATDIVNSEKGSTIGPAKGLLKLTEDNFRALLDAAMEQPDTELLLQRHFTALLTAVWKVRSCVDRQRNNSVPKSHCYPSIRLFGTSVNPKSERLLKGPSERSFNLHQCSKLITTALHDVESMGPDNMTSQSNQMDEDPPPIEKLDVMLEFVKMGGETEGCSSGFPSIIPLTIPGLDLVSPSKIPSEEGQLRPSQHMAECRFRAVSNAGFLDVHGWVSSAFRINDSKSRPFAKSSTLGKHKLGIGETSRPSKSKARKVVAEPTEISPFVDPLLQLPPTTIPNDHSSTSTYLSDVLDGSFEDVLLDTSYGVEGEHLCEPNGLEMVHHRYDPSFISGLDNCSSLPEYTDAG